MQLLSAPPRYILGTLPPPLGGVTVFLHRRLAQFRHAGTAYRVKDWQRMSWLERCGWLLMILLDPRPSTYELHGLETMAMTALVLRPFRKEIVYWMHSGRFPAKLQGFRRLLFGKFLETADETVLVSVHLRDQLESAGFLVPQRHRIQHAFLPPPLEEDSVLWNQYAPEVQAFVTQQRPLLVMQGSDGFHKGIDLYGTDLALEMAALLRERFPDFGLVIGRPSAGDAAFQSYHAELQARIERDGLCDNVYFLTGEQQLWPIIRRADVFLRPTYQDGDSVSVREALFLQVPVVASDACPRPEGVHCFTNRHAVDFARAVAEVLPSVSPDKADVLRAEVQS